MIPQLNFRIVNQTINRIDDFQPVSQSKNYLMACFEFITDDWNNIDNKTAIFKTENNELYKAVITDGLCIVPSEATVNNGYIYVSVYGGDRITTNSIAVFIDESGYIEDEENNETNNDNSGG